MLQTERYKRMDFRMTDNVENKKSRDKNRKWQY